MSSSTTTTTTAAAAGAGATATATSNDATIFMERITCWCHFCNTSVTPSSSSATTTSLLCPHCNSDFLEELLISNNNPNPDFPYQNSSRLLFPSFVDPSIPTTSTDSNTSFPFPSVPPSDDNFLLDSPYLHRLIHHLTNSDDSSPSTTATATTSRHHFPASRSAVEAIPLIKITSSFLDIDPIVLCAVCKDQFVIDDEMKQLPCKHMYHPECILPWLAQRNSCPVCRFQLPTESVRGDLKVRRRTRSRVLRLGDLMEDLDDEAMLALGFRHLTRRHRHIFPMSHHQYRQPAVESEAAFPSTETGETVEVDVLPDSGRANRSETVPIWPNWPVDGGAVDGGHIGLNATWVDDADVAMP